MPRIVDVPSGKKAFIDVPSPNGRTGWSARTKASTRSARSSNVSRQDVTAPSGLFAGACDRPLWHSNWRQAVRWVETVKELGLPGLRVHDLRHSGITYLLDVGVPVHVVQNIAGHASLRTTQLYTHHTSTAFDDAVRRVNEAVNSDLARTCDSDRSARSA